MLHRMPLGRAIGRGAKTVIDATAGFGGDALLLAAMGLDVLCIERSAAVLTVLREAIACAREDPRLGPASRRIEIIDGDARDVLRELTGAARPDLVYLDPMFPPKRRRSALPPRDAQLLQRLLADEPDDDGLLEAALAAATRRVLWKRPSWAPPVQPAATVSYRGPRIRYEVWVIPGRPSPAFRG